MDPDVQNRLTREILALTVRSEREAVAHFVGTLQRYVLAAAPAARMSNGERTLELFADALHKMAADIDQVFAAKLKELTDA